MMKSTVYKVLRTKWYIPVLMVGTLVTAVTDVINGDTETYFYSLFMVPTLVLFLFLNELSTMMITESRNEALASLNELLESHQSVLKHAAWMDELLQVLAANEGQP